MKLPFYSGYISESCCMGLKSSMSHHTFGVARKLKNAPPFSCDLIPHLESGAEN